LIYRLLRKPTPEEVYPAELRGSIIIENQKFNDQRAPEQHNKKQEKSIIMLLLFSIAAFGDLMNNIPPPPPVSPGVIVV
jgi:hypothetical protein